MKLDDLINSSCVIGLSYFDERGVPLKQTQYAGTVTQVDAELGISVRLQHSEENSADKADAQPEFILPPNLSAWFKAPVGHYRHAATGVDMENPDYLVTWDIHRTQEQREDGQHEWWDWVANKVPPQVG